MDTASASTMPSTPAVQFEAHLLEQLFADCFEQRWRTRLLGGAQEPHYQPADGASAFHLLYYRSDYFASALHEIAHWCIAGERRRTLPDFGYWYAPEGRNPNQQRAFEAVEAKPQALEWLFSLACGYRFYLSADNLNSPDGVVPDSTSFKRLVLAEASGWQEIGLPLRARIFFAALATQFGTHLKPEDLRLQLAGLAG